MSIIRNLGKMVSNIEVISKVELIKLNPYSEVAQAEFVAIGRGQEFTAFHFTLNAEGEVIKLSNVREALIGAKSVYGVENQTNELDIQSNRI